MSDFTDEQLKNISGKKDNTKAEDPSGNYPSLGYIRKENTNTAARGETRNSLKWAGFSEGVEYILNQEYVGSIYPYNQVSQSITGHVWEVDDTPGNERILIKHADGAGIELGVDGSVSISALNNRIEVTGGDQYITIVGDAKLNYQGNLDMKVTGEFNIECNEFNIDVKNNKNETIGGAEKKEVYKGVTTSVVGNVANFVTENVTDTILGGHQHNVKGDLTYNVNGNIGTFASGNINITAEDYVNMASDNVTISAQDLTVQGGTGTIGGTSVNYVGNGAIFDEGVTAPTFHGDLDGTANKAIEADTAYYHPASAGGYIPHAGSSPGYSITNTATPAITKPTATNVLTYLLKAAGGIRKVKIDIGNYLKNFIDKADRYSGVSSKPMTPVAVRSKLRDTVNRNNSTLVGNLIAEGNLCEDFKTPTPPGIGRIIDGDSTTYVPKGAANARVSTNNVVYIPRNAVKQFLPDPIYNPLNYGSTEDITAKTKIMPGLSLSKFLGSDDSANIKHIRDRSVKIEIAKHLYLQGLILKKIQSNNNDFDGVTLEVTEGLYKPGATETVTPNSINDLKSKGRAIVYKAVNAKGEVSNNRLFDIASYLKDTAYFDQMILSYDTIECDAYGMPVVSARLIITMPEIDDNYTGTFKREVFTEFNANKLSQGELVEVLPYKRNENNFNFDPSGSEWVLYRSGLSAYNKDIKPELYNKIVAIAKTFGQPLTITSGRRPSTSTAGVGSRSKHVTREAVDILTPFSDIETERLIKIAIEHGITGIGIYRTKARGGGSSFNGVHFDIRSSSKASWGDNYSRTTLYRYPWAHKVLGQNGFPIA